MTRRRKPPQTDFSFHLRPLKEKFDKTGDVRYAFLAIGEGLLVKDLRPDSPDQWALQVAYDFAESNRRDVVRFDDPPKRGGGVRRPESDGELLDAMEAVLSTKGSSVKAAAERVSMPLRDGTDEGDRQADAQVRRLERLWRGETQGSIGSNKVRALNYRPRGSAEIRLRQLIERDRKESR